MARALLASGLSMDSPVIHTGGSNPFARDVMNLAPIGKMFQTYYGNKRLDESNAAVQQIAQMVEQNRQSDVQNMMGKLQPSTSQDTVTDQAPGEDTQTFNRTTTKPPEGIVAAIAAGLQSSNPSVQSQAEGMQKGYMEALIKGMQTPEATAALVRGGVDPRTIKTTTDPMYGLPVMGNRPDQLGMQTKYEKVGPAETVLPTVAGGVNATPPAGGSPAAPVYTNEGGPKVAMDVTGDLRKDLVEGKAHVQGFLTEAPKLQGLISLLDKGTVATGVGKTGEWLTEARRFAQQAFGVSSETAQKITDTKTLVSMLLPIAAEGVHSFTPRGSQMELTQYGKAYGSSTNVDPAAVRNMLAQVYAEGMNRFVQHNQNVGLARDNSLMGPKVAQMYQVPVKPGMLEDTNQLLEGQQYPFTAPLGQRNSGPRGAGTTPTESDSRWEMVNDANHSYPQ